MSGLVTRFAYDQTGTNPDNLITNEPHVLSNNAVRAFAPIYGPFYTDNALVYDAATNALLERGTQYQFVELLKEISLKTGKEICCVVLILDRNVSGHVTISYNCVGGLYQNEVATGIVNLYETVAADNRPVAWKDVLNKPLQFEPTDHLHLLKDINGFEPVVTVLERIRNAIMLSDVPVYEAMIEYFNQLVADLQVSVENGKLTIAALMAQMTALEAALNAEINARGLEDNSLSALIADLASQLQSEINNRSAGDNSLNGLITAEANARTTADNTEKTARIAGDAGLQTQLDNLGTALSTSYLRLDGTNNMTGVLRNNRVWDGIEGTFSLKEVNAYIKWGATKATNTLNDMLFGVSTAGVFNWFRFNGTSYVTTATLDANGNFTVTGDLAAYSDQRLKTDWKRIENALSKIEAIEGGTFRHIASGESSLGVIAQTVRAVIPEAVKMDENGYLKVSYGNMVGLLIEGIKELNAVVKQQQLEIEALKKKSATY